MQNTKQPDAPTAGQPVNSDTDVNQTDHISAQLDQEDNNEEEEDEGAAKPDEAENVTDEETDDIEWDPNQQAGDKGDGQTL